MRGEGAVEMQGVWSVFHDHERTYRVASGKCAEAVPRSLAGGTCIEAAQRACLEFGSGPQKNRQATQLLGLNLELRLAPHG